MYTLVLKKLIACYTAVSSDKSRLNRGSGNTIKLPLFLRVILACDGKGDTSHWTNPILLVSEKSSNINDTSWTIVGNKNLSLVFTYKKLIYMHFKSHMIFGWCIRITCMLHFNTYNTS